MAFSKLCKYNRSHPRLLNLFTCAITQPVVIRVPSDYTNESGLLSDLKHRPSDRRRLDIDRHLCRINQCVVEVDPIHVVMILNMTPFLSTLPPNFTLCMSPFLSTLPPNFTLCMSPGCRVGGHVVVDDLTVARACLRPLMTTRTHCWVLPHTLPGQPKVLATGLNASS